MYSGQLILNLSAHAVFSNGYNQTIVMNHMASLHINAIASQLFLIDHLTSHVLLRTLLIVATSCAIKKERHLKYIAVVA